MFPKKNGRFNRLDSPGNTGPSAVKSGGNQKGPGGSPPTQPKAESLHSRRCGLTPAKDITMSKLKNPDAKWSIERTHQVTGVRQYLSPGEVNWIPVHDHEKYGTRYGRWVWGDAEEIMVNIRRGNTTGFDYVICLFEKINKPAITTDK